jgi:hypothetical protein
MHRDGWHCQFLEADCKTPLPKKLTFANKAKLWELAEQRRLRDDPGGSPGDRTRDRERDRGGFWLNLTEEQYRKLK